MTTEHTSQNVHTPGDTGPQPLGTEGRTGGQRVAAAHLEQGVATQPTEPRRQGFVSLGRVAGGGRRAQSRCPPAVLRHLPRLRPCRLLAARWLRQHSSQADRKGQPSNAPRACAHRRLLPR